MEYFLGPNSLQCNGVTVTLGGNNALLSMRLKAVTLRIDKRGETRGVNGNT